MDIKKLQSLKLSHPNLLCNTSKSHIAVPAACLFVNEYLEPEEDISVIPVAARIHWKPFLNRFSMPVIYREVPLSHH